MQEGGKQPMSNDAGHHKGHTAKEGKSIPKTRPFPRGENLIEKLDETREEPAASGRSKKENRKRERSFAFYWRRIRHFKQQNVGGGTVGKSRGKL